MKQGNSFFFVLLSRIKGLWSPLFSADFVIVDTVHNDEKLPPLAEPGQYPNRQY